MAMAMAMAETPNPIVARVREIRGELSELIRYVRKHEDDEAYKEYCEGLIAAARAALAVISGD